MDMNEISHLDAITPFDAIESVERALTTTRAALAVQLAALTFDAKQDDREPCMVDALSHLWCAHAALTEAIEVDDA